MDSAVAQIAAKSKAPSNWHWLLMKVATNDLIQFLRPAGFYYCDRKHATGLLDSFGLNQNIGH